MNERSRLRDASDSVEQLAQKPRRGAPAVDQETPVVGHSQPLQALSGRMRSEEEEENDEGGQRRDRLAEGLSAHGHGR